MKNQEVNGACNSEQEKVHEYRPFDDNRVYYVLVPLTRFQNCVYYLLTGYRLWRLTSILLFLSLVITFYVVIGATRHPCPFCKERYKSVGNKKLGSPPPKPGPDQCVNIINSERFDCYPQGSATEKSCNARGCCWAALPNGSVSDLNVPYCYYPKSQNTYKTINITVTDLGATVFLQNVYQSPYPNDINVVKMDFSYETEDRLHVKVC